MDPIQELRQLLEGLFSADRLRALVREAREREGKPLPEECVTEVVSWVLLLESAASAYPSGCRVQVMLGAMRRTEVFTYAEHGFASLFFDVDGHHTSTKFHEEMQDY